LQEITQDILIYIQSNPVLSLIIAFIAGFLATRIVAAERRPGAVGFTIIGLIGFFLGHFMIAYYEYTEYLDSLLELRVIADMIAAFVGSFVIAGIIHFVRPT
jgi:uncharacterized membrane protein YeaQ/YmgE (transglycosylase-associated protein family)